MLEALFSHISYCLMFYVFYTVIHVFGELIFTTNTRILSVFKFVHWGIVGLFVALCIVDWSWYVAGIDSVVNNEWSLVTRMNVWQKLDSVRWIIFWLSAWEIIAWALFLGLMASRGSSYLKLKVGGEALQAFRSDKNSISFIANTE